MFRMSCLKVCLSRFAAFEGTSNTARSEAQSHFNAGTCFQPVKLLRKGLAGKRAHKALRVQPSKLHKSTVKDRMAAQEAIKSCSEVTQVTCTSSNSYQSCLSNARLVGRCSASQQAECSVAQCLPEASSYAGSTRCSAHRPWSQCVE